MLTKSLNLAQPKILAVEEIAPVRTQKFAAGHWFFDFGRAAFGTIRLTVTAERKTSVTLHLGEKLDANGRIDRKPPGCVRYRAIPLTLDPGSRTLQIEIPPDEHNTGPAAIRMPRELFEVLPFRYAELENTDTAAMKNCDMTQLAVFYPFDCDAADFQSDDTGLNRVWDLCKYSIKATSFCGVYVDGDRERVPYEADAYINQLCHYGVDTEYEMVRRTLEHLLFHPTWPTDWQLHCVPMAWADFQHTGRTDMLSAYYEILQSKALLALAREDGLISTETGLVTPELLAELFLDNHSNPLRDLVDWPPGSFAIEGSGERDNYDMAPVKTVTNALHAWNLKLLTRIADVLNKPEDERFYRNRFQQVVGSLQKTFFRHDRGLFVDGECSEHSSLHANMLPAAFGLIPAGREKKVLEFIKSRGMACSVYGAQYLLEACYNLNAGGYALELMTADHDRSWLNMLRLGSTVTLEAWDHHYKKNLDWNHAWGAAPANIIPRFAAGVRPARPGFTEIIIAPQPGYLKYINAKVPTPHGPVRVRIEPAAESRRHLNIETPVPARFDPSGIESPKDTEQPEEIILLNAGQHEIRV